MKSSLPSVLSVERKTLGSSWYIPPFQRRWCNSGPGCGHQNLSLLQRWGSRWYCFCFRLGLGWRGRGVEGQEVGAFREGKHPLGVWVSVCVCLNLSVCVCALEPPPQKSRDASSGGGCPVCPFPLLLAVPSQEPLPWAPLQAGPGSTRNIEDGAAQQATPTGASDGCALLAPLSL